MGEYKISREEIYNKLLETLDNFEGNISKYDFLDMANELADNYDNFEDI